MEQGLRVRRKVSVLTPSYGVGFKGSEKSIRSYSKLSSRVQRFGEKYPFLLQAMEQGLRVWRIVSIFSPSYRVGFKLVQRIVSVLTPSYGVGFKGSENSIRPYSKL